MRIISGTIRGRQLASFSGKEIRPTPDRVREALFSMLTSRLGSFNQLKVLELFCGSGAQSLEALSRGADSAVMVDSGRDALTTASENIKRCKFEDKTKLVKQDVYTALKTLINDAPFDLILLDPPYKQGHIPEVIKKIESLQLLADDGIICAESAKGEDPGQYTSLTQLDSRVYGTTQIYLFGFTED
jgi:16S rRNA (guanine966-N2)-methyltransferase